MTARRILLHVGSPKCGSTFLQRALRQSREALLARGVHYPDPGGGAGHPGNAADLEHLTRPGMEALFPSGTHTAILSHEDLYTLPKRGDALASLAAEDGTEVQLLVFLRPVSDFVFGDYSQFMKQNFEAWIASRAPYKGEDFEAFALRRAAKLDPATFIARWHKRFPDRAPLLAGHGAIRPAVTALLGPAAGAIDWAVPRDLTNPSLRVADCEALAAALADPAQTPEALRAALSAAFGRIGQPDPGRTPARIAAIEAAAAPANAALLEAYGYDNRLGAENRL